MNEKIRYLKAGEVRKPDDEVCHLGIPPKGLQNWSGQDDEIRNGYWMWHKVSLVGYPILASDLMIAEFRRRV